MFRIAPMFFYDPAIIQAWLEDQAKRGWFVYEYKGFGASFWQEEPKEVRFRVEPGRTDEERPDAETQAAYREMGWNYVCPMDKAYHIWRCDDPGVPELNTDPQVQAAGYDHLLRRSRKGWRMLGAFWAVLLLVPLVMVLAGKYYIYRSVQTWSPWYIDGMRYLVLIACVLLLGFSAWRQGRYLKVLRAGVPQPHRKPYRGTMAMSRAVLVLLAAFVVLQAADWLQPDSHSFLPVSDCEGPVPCVELEGMGVVRAARWENLSTREQWWMIQRPDDFESADFVESRYYDFYLRHSAERVEQSLLNYWDGQSPWNGLAPVEAEGLDAAWYGRDGGVQYLTARLGSRLMYLCCWDSTEELLDYLDDCRQVLAEH